MKFVHGTCALAVAAALGGCASSAKDIQAAYVSPVAYQGYTCDQLGAEAARVSARAVEVSGQQDNKATGDAAATAVGAVLFFPALFFIKGDGTTAAELSRLKGEMQAIEQANIQKKCGLQIRRTSSATG